MGDVKVAILGAESSGKSQLAKCLLGRGIFSADESVPQISTQYSEIKIAEYDFEIRDLPGDPRLAVMNNFYLLDADIILYCIDVSLNPAAYLESKLKEIEDLNHKYPNASIILVGTKNDSPNTNTEILQNLKKNTQIQIAGLVSTSSKEKETAAPLLEEMVKVSKARQSNVEMVEATEAQIHSSRGLFSHQRKQKNKDLVALNTGMQPFLPSLLSDDQVKEVFELITILRKEIDSCWPYPNKALKEAKVTALTDLLKRAKDAAVDNGEALLHFTKAAESQETMAKIINDVETAHNSMNQGDWSKRTSKLMDSLKSSYPLEEDKILTLYI